MARDMIASETQSEDIVFALAASPGFRKDGICFAASQSGLYRSDDGGGTWRSMYGSLNLEPPLTTVAVTLSPDFGSDQTVFAGVQGGVLCSTDGGDTWQAALLPSPPPDLSTVIVSPDFTRDGIVLAGTMEDGVFRSTNGGRRWHSANFGLLDLHVLCLAISPDFANDETILAGTESGIFRSTNGGRSWREVDFAAELAPVLSLALSPNYAGDAIVLAGTETCGLFCSKDKGNTWTRLGQDLTSVAINGIVTSLEHTGKLEILILLSERLIVSRDGGQRWSTWKKKVRFRQSLTSVAAPSGLRRGAPLLVGLADGSALRID